MSATAFAKVWVSQADFTVGAVEANANLLLEHATKAFNQNARLLVAGELALSGYPPQDLLFRKDFLAHIHKAIELIAAKAPLPILFGTPFLEEQKLYNAAVLANEGVARVVTKKTSLPNYGVFDELRFFTAGNEAPQPFLLEGIGSLACFICEDIWQPIKKCKGNIIAINASPFEHQKPATRLATAKKRVKETNKSLLYVNLFGGQDEVVFDGRSFALNQNQQLVWQAPQWQQVLEPVTEDLAISPKPIHPKPIPPKPIPKEFEPAETYQALVVGLRHYAAKSGFDKTLLGLSGGIDSAITAAIAVDALGAKNVAALIMPSPYSEHSEVAEELAKGLGIGYDSIPITSLMKQFDNVFSRPLKGLAAENLQARLRAVLLMAKSNSDGSLLLTTGNKSETAVGYTTLYGDMCGGFSLLKDVYKTQVYELARWRNENSIANFLGESKRVISQRAMELAPSAELKPNQLDQDTLPPYEELDRALLHLIEKNAPPATAPNPMLARKCWRMILNAEYKRSQSAPGVKVSNSLFGWDRRYPIINHFKE